MLNKPCAICQCLKSIRQAVGRPNLALGLYGLQRHRQGLAKQRVVVDHQKLAQGLFSIHL